jgi:hypothetical protein
MLREFVGVDHLGHANWRKEREGKSLLGYHVLLNLGRVSETHQVSGGLCGRLGF